MTRQALVPPALSRGPFRTADAIAAGLNHNHLRGSAWRRLFPGIYADSRLPVDHRLLCQAAGLLLPPGGAVGPGSAAHLWGVRGLDPGPDVVTLVPWPVKLRPQPNLVVRRAQLTAGDITPLSGIPVATPARTALSLSDGLAESPMETRMRLAMLDSGLPPPTAQFKIFRGKRFVARVDWAYEEQKLALEYDGDYHREKATFPFDMERQRELAHLGWRVLRFNADDVLRFRTEWSSTSAQPCADLERWVRNTHQEINRTDPL